MVFVAKVVRLQRLYLEGLRFVVKAFEQDGGCRVCVHACVRACVCVCESVCVRV